MTDGGRGAREPRARTRGARWGRAALVSLLVSLVVPPAFDVGLGDSAGLVLFRGVLEAQSAEPGPSELPVVRAHRVERADGEIRIDGHLNEPAWQAATPITDFRQQDPVAA